MMSQKACLCSIPNKHSTEIIGKDNTKLLTQMMQWNILNFVVYTRQRSRSMSPTKLLKKSVEYDDPLSVAFIDYVKAFDSATTSTAMKAIKKQFLEMGRT